MLRLDYPTLYFRSFFARAQVKLQSASRETNSADDKRQETSPRGQSLANIGTLGSQ